MTSRNTLSNSRPLLCAALAGTAIAALLSGCSTKDSWRANPTPGVDTAGMTSDVVANNMVNFTDTNLRLLNEDLGRFFFFDRPMRLAKRTIPY